MRSAILACLVVLVCGFAVSVLLAGTTAVALETCHPGCCGNTPRCTGVGACVQPDPTEMECSQDCVNYCVPDGNGSLTPDPS